MTSLSFVFYDYNLCKPVLLPPTPKVTAYEYCTDYIVNKCL